MFHMAPELLRLPEDACDGSAEADIYSFSMISYQVILQQELYANTNSPPEGKSPSPSPRKDCHTCSSFVELLTTIMQRSSIPLRPTLGGNNWDVHVDLVNLMRRCWEEMPEHRPKASDLKTTVTQCMGGK
jgi:hypothetical protein